MLNNQKGRVIFIRIFLAACETYKAVFRPTPGCKERLLDNFNSLAERSLISAPVVMTQYGHSLTDGSTHVYISPCPCII